MFCRNTYRIISRIRLFYGLHATNCVNVKLSNKIRKKLISYPLHMLLAIDGWRAYTHSYTRNWMKTKTKIGMSSVFCSRFVLCFLHFDRNASHGNSQLTDVFHLKWTYPIESITNIEWKIMEFRANKNVFLPLHWVKLREREKKSINKDTFHDQQFNLSTWMNCMHLKIALASDILLLLFWVFSRGSFFTILALFWLNQ